MIAIGEMRLRLRDATRAPHERLHQHPGFAAAAAGRISIADYKLLLCRLFGFHRAFEMALAAGHFGGIQDSGDRARSRLIEADLEALGIEANAIALLPRCPGLKAPTSEAEILGAQYVLEGSTLGGVQIARALEPVVNRPDGQGRRFYLGYGDQHGAMWRAFLAELEPLAAHPQESADVIAAAIRTFEAFELWMQDWKALYSPRPFAACDPV